MELIFVIGLITLIILISNYHSANKEKTTRLNDTLSWLIKEIEQLRLEIKNLRDQKYPAPEKKTEEKPPVVIPKIIEEPKAPVIPKIKEEARKEEHAGYKSIYSVVEEGDKVLSQEKKEAQPTEGWWEKWMRNNPDLEKFIGENLINKIGIAVLVLGIAFFVKYAIDKDWIHEGGRVSIGLICGSALIVLAHYLRKNYRSFSSVLAGGGLAVFYFTIAFAFHQYHLISQNAAFIIMIVITGFAVALSVLYDRLELAVVAAVGGFITPFLVSTGEGNYIVLFTYLIILNVGLLTLSWFKKWNLINIISLFFTILIFGGWLLVNLLKTDYTFPYKNAMLFATAFYVIFLGMDMINNIRTRKPFRAFDFSILIIINFTYYAAGMLILNEWNNGEYRGLFTSLAGMVNLILAFYFFRSKKGDRNLLYLLIGLTLTFISLAAPVQLKGHAITLFWCAECVLLLWLFRRSRIVIFKYASALVTVLMFISLMMDWSQAADKSSYNLPIIFSGVRGIVTNLVAVVSFALQYFLLTKEEQQAEYIWGIRNFMVRTLMIILAVALLYCTCIFGINLYFGNETSFAIPNIYHRLITNIFVIALLAVIRRYDKTNRFLQGTLIATAFAAYLFSSQLIYQARSNILAGQYPMLHLVVHWLSCILLIMILYHAIKLCRSNFEKKNLSYISFFTWLISGMLVFIFSFEALNVYVTLGHRMLSVDQLEKQFTKAGLTILWGLCSFVLMWLGMKYKYKPLRIISLTLFTVSLLKLFLYDIKNIGEGGKIAAFIMLGVLLLTVSFMYQKLKKIIIDDTTS